LPFPSRRSSDLETSTLGALPEWNSMTIVVVCATHVNGGWRDRTRGLSSQTPHEVRADRDLSEEHACPSDMTRTQKSYGTGFRCRGERPCAVILAGVSAGFGSLPDVHGSGSSAVMP